MLWPRSLSKELSKHTYAITVTETGIREVDSWMEPYIEIHEWEIEKENEILQDIDDIFDDYSYHYSLSDYINSKVTSSTLGPHDQSDLVMTFYVYEDNKLYTLVLGTEGNIRINGIVCKLGYLNHNSKEIIDRILAILPETKEELTD